jgi:predicted transcriptional regulator
MDWKKLISEIQACGYSQAAIGKALGRSQAYIADIVSGRYGDLKWSDGQALRRLHHKATKQQEKAAA